MATSQLIATYNSNHVQQNVLDINDQSLNEVSTDMTETVSLEGITYYSQIIVARRCKVTVSATSLQSEVNISSVYSQTSAFNTQTGWPTQYTDPMGPSVYPPALSFATLYSVVLEAGTYYFWWRNENRSQGYSDYIAIKYHADQPPVWSIVDDQGGIIGTISNTYTLPQPISAAAYTLYRYSVKFVDDGTCKFESLTVDNVRLYVTHGTQGTEYTFNDQNGTVSGSGVDVSTFSQFATFTARANIWYDFWIRFDNGSRTGDLNFKITPPGQLWNVVSYNSDTTVTQSGVSWTVDGAEISAKEIDYIPLYFDPAVSRYQVSGTSSINYDVYITTSTSIDGNGVPAEVVNTGTTGSSGFSFEFIPQSPQKRYYIMFRTSDGYAAGNHSLSISIQYLGVVDRWYLNVLDGGTVDIRTTQFKYKNEYDIHQIYKKVVRFTESGTIAFYSQATTGASAIPGIAKAWITRHTTSFDQYNGAPPDPDEVDYIAYDLNPDENRQFSMPVVQVVAGIDYDFWFRLCDGSQIGENIVIIDVPGGGGGTNTWTYQHDNHADRYSITQSFTEEIALIPGVGEYFAVTFNSAARGRIELSLPSDAEAFIYVNHDSQSYSDETGIPTGAITGSGSFSMSFEASSGTYRIWVRGSTTAIQAQYTLTVTIIQWQSATMSGSPFSIASQDVRSRFNLSEGTIYLAEVTFSSSGEANFYSNDGNTRLAWLTSSNSGITPSTGIPLGTILASDTRGSGNFGFVYNVTAGVTYYFWVRSNVFRDTTALDLYFVPPGSAATSKGFWICTAVSPNIEWTKVRVYVCTSENPVTWGLVEHPSICVEEGQSVDWVIGT